MLLTTHRPVLEGHGISALLLLARESSGLRPAELLWVFTYAGRNEHTAFGAA